MAVITPFRELSLRGRLLRLVGWPLLAVLLLSAVYDYYSALDRASDSQDLALARVAIALASRLDTDADDNDNLALHLARMMSAIQQADRQDRLQYLVTRQDSQWVGGDPALAALAGPAGAVGEPTFQDRRGAGEKLRVVTYPYRASTGLLNVVVAETTRRRDVQAQLVVVDTVIPDLVLVVLALGLVYLGVHLAMLPLDRLGQAVAARDPDDLSPVPAQGLAGELQPLVRSINRLMEHLRSSAESQQAFLSTAAHQLRTPLAGMQTQIELASRDADGPQRARLAALHEAMLRMGRSTSQMLALARSGPQATQVESFHDVDLQQLVEDSASTWLDAALAASVDIGFDARPAVVRGSAWMLRELLGNLIHNAIRHCPPNGRVTVRCSSTHGEPAGSPRCVLEVEDDGPGIPLAERERVFERFYQAPGAAQGGSGLGLAIVREVALRHGAKVTLDDGPSGEGLCVSVELPAQG